MLHSCYLCINIFPKFGIEGDATFCQIYQNEIALTIFIVDSRIPHFTEIYLVVLEMKHSARWRDRHPNYASTHELYENKV
jgi:hypothetical protein